ncbi:hypothetical protein DL96DRAFT_1023363 [Flagelloscypha sp. PMI_526]|nr:hypothetical protein DL96DRAFT_1023363 [Flagelloscypha sp. PMI_526]
MGAFNLTVGALLLGFSLNLYLYGLVSHQYMAYATIKFNDPIWIHILVTILFVIDTSETIVELYGVWYFAVENYANPNVLIEVTWVWPFCGVANAISAGIVQVFFLRRLWGFTKQAWLCSFLAVLAIGACLCGVIVCTWSGLLVDVTQWAPLIPFVTAWLAVEAAMDVIITVILSRALWRRKTGFTRTNTIIHRSIRAAVQSGFFSSVFAFFGLLSFVIWTDTYFYAIFSWPLGRIYSYSLLYTLVARKELSKIAYGTSDAGEVRVNSFPTSLQISSVKFRQSTTADAQVDCDKMKSPLDQCIGLPPPKGSA